MDCPRLDDEADRHSPSSGDTVGGLGLEVRDAGRQLVDLLIRTSTVTPADLTLLDPASHDPATRDTAAADPATGS